jgi:hypothetical protein
MELMETLSLSLCTVIADPGAYIKLDKIELMGRLDQRPEFFDVIGPKS